MPQILVICGATASGKTSLAVDLAKKLNTEIISADSLLIYKGLNIGTAKPTATEMQGVYHSLIDVIDNDKSFAVSDYENLAVKEVEKLIKNNKTAIICGGTGFYINSVLFKSSFGQSAKDEKIRKKYEDFLSINGANELHKLLEKVDVESAKKLHYNDTKRVIRALEIFDLTGKKKSEQKDDLTPRYDYLAFAIDFPRDELYQRINMRVDIMFENGLLKEVESLKNSGLDLDNQCMQGIGYKEFFEYFNGNLTLEETKELIKKNTRNYAKRQITFFKKLPNLIWLKPKNATAKYICEMYL